MRLWSIHPEYLDWKGLSALWRESLLAQKVLMNQTKGWRNHPQLLRFKNHRDSIGAIGLYLLKIHEESVKRGYKYNKTKILKQGEEVDLIKVSRGQLLYEYEILKKRLKTRDHGKYQQIIREHVVTPIPHPLFYTVEGNVEHWERSYWIKEKRLEFQS